MGAAKGSWPIPLNQIKCQYDLSQERALTSQMTHLDRCQSCGVACRQDQGVRHTGMLSGKLCTVVTVLMRLVLLCIEVVSAGSGVHALSQGENKKHY